MESSENFEPNKILVKAASIFLLIGLTFIVYVGITTRRSLSNETRYTIGHTSKIVYLYSSGRGVRYSYIVNGVTYENTVTYSYDSKVPGRYLVRFSVENPEISEIYQDRPVPESIIEAPSNGWKKRPW